MEVTRTKKSSQSKSHQVSKPNKRRKLESDHSCEDDVTNGANGTNGTNSANASPFGSKEEASDEPSSKMARSGKVPKMTKMTETSEPMESKQNLCRSGGGLTVNQQLLEVVMQGTRAQKPKKDVQLEYFVGLSSDQRKAVQYVLEGHNVFITGAAGTGKSHLIASLVSYLQGKLGKRVQLTASTGMAAVNIQGVTIHSFSCVSGDDMSTVNIQQRGRTLFARRMWQNIDVLILDECSMLSPSFFHRVDAIARVARGNNGRPFGGVQLIVLGDFFQLPPIVKDKMLNNQTNWPEFLFETETWKKSIHRVVELTEVHRQDDHKFIDLLHRVRRGEPTEQDVQTLYGCMHTQFPDDDIEPTLLCTTNKQVDEQNQMRMHKLPGEFRVYQMVSGIKELESFSDINETRKQASEKKMWRKQELEKAREKLIRDVTVDEQLYLKKGAQVMLCANLKVDDGLCNGSRGIIVGFTKPVQGSASSETMGMTGKPKTTGTSTAEGSISYPIVKFVNREKPLIIRPYQWQIPMSKHYSVFVGQIPLRVAYAITIHKSQGQTLDRIQMSLTRIFSPGQGYVALSRARNLKSVYLTEFDPKCIRCHPKVLQFYASLAEKNQTSSGSVGSAGSSSKPSSKLPRFVQQLQNQETQEHQENPEQDDQNPNQQEDQNQENNQEDKKDQKDQDELEVPEDPKDTENFEDRDDSEDPEDPENLKDPEDPEDPEDQKGQDDQDDREIENIGESDAEMNEINELQNPVDDFVDPDPQEDEY